MSSSYARGEVRRPSLVLLSGDSDFQSLIKYLKAFGKTCVVMSTKGHVSIELVKEAKLLDFKKIRKDIEFK